MCGYEDEHEAEAEAEACQGGNLRSYGTLVAVSMTRFASSLFG